MLKKVVGDPSTTMPIETIEVNKELSYEEIPIAILDRKVCKLRNKEVASVKNKDESSLVVEVKGKQYNDALLAQLEEGIHKHNIIAFYFGIDDGTLWCQGHICVPDIDGLWERILVEAHTSRYSVLPGSTKMYHDLKEVYRWDNRKKDVADFVAKSLNYQQVKTCIEENWKFQVDDWVFLKVSPMKGVMRFGKKGKLIPRQVRKLRNTEVASVKVPWKSQQVEEAT
uniref:Uncharacterized protein LOC104242968 n=1 Tax=Nicotiana sylvestris TaxID=4096 RepID=A0A1U7Y349_NICSY|nr:PREDICTED: uncharacterized protein LOC104242968 [Nicotiana sylvestris]